MPKGKCKYENQYRECERGNLDVGESCTWHQKEYCEDYEEEE